MITTLLISAAAVFGEGDPTALSDRLLMHWNTHATDVYVRNEAVVGVGGKRAPEPTVVFCGNRSHATDYLAPKIEDLPRREEDPRGLLLVPRDGGAKVRVPYGKTGCLIGNINRAIVKRALAADDSQAWNVLDVYLKGIYYRNVPTDLGHGHLQTLFGMQSMETIHDDIIDDICRLYSRFEDHPEIHKAALRKWADVQIANGVADNNWDMMQLNYILAIGLALGGTDKEHYVDVVMNQSSVRNYSVKKLAETGFDRETGIWWECPGYSVAVTLKDFAKFATRVKNDLGIDLVEEIPVLKKAFPAAGEYLFPDGLLIGFGDTHPCAIPKEVLAYAEPKTSPFFHAPNASWLVARSGMDPTNDVAFALNASLGNHQHANGISLELYARGYRLAPDAGIGWTLYSGDDYKEYYSQFPAHNTVMVNSRSTCQTMKSYHPFELVAHGENWAKVRFREPATNAKQERTVRYVKDAEGAYFVDVFRSRVGEEEAPGGEWHDYYYHNLGDTLTLDGEVEPTEAIAFVESGLCALSYIKDKKARKGRGDLVATFDWKRPEGLVRTRLFMNDAGGRTFISAFAPATEGLSRVKKPDYGITRDSRTPCLVVRQRGEAWERPFVAVIDPSGTVSSVAFERDRVLVRRASGKTDMVEIE